MITAIVETLLDNSAVTAIVDQRVEPWQRAEGGAATLPCVLYGIDGEDCTRGLNGTVLKQATLRVSSFSTSLASSQLLDEKVIDALDGVKPTGIDSIRRVSTEWETVEPFDGSEEYYYETSTLFDVWYT